MTCAKGYRPWKRSTSVPLFSAFYSPLISTFSAGFCGKKVLIPIVGIVAGRIGHRGAGRRLSACRAVGPESGLWSPERRDAERRSLRADQRDGRFFHHRRDTDPDFTWDKLEGADVRRFPVA